MVKALAPDRTDQTLHGGVLPGRPGSRWSIPDTQHPQMLPHDMAIDGVSISQQISRPRVPRERLGYLPSNQLGRWVCRYHVVNELPPAVCQKHQTVEQLKADRRNNEQVQGANSPCMVAQEGGPSLARSSGALDHVLGDGRLGDLDAELEQLAVNPGRTP